MTQAQAVEIIRLLTIIGLAASIGVGCLLVLAVRALWREQPHVHVSIEMDGEVLGEAMVEHLPRAVERAGFRRSVN